MKVVTEFGGSWMSGMQRFWGHRRQLLAAVALLLAAAAPAGAQVNFDPPLYDWQADNQASGWSISQAAATLKIEGGMLFYQANSGLNRLSSPDNLGLPSASYRHIDLHLRNGTAATSATLFFITNEDTAWNTAKSLTFPLVARDHFNRHHALDLTQVQNFTAAGFTDGLGGPPQTLRRFRIEITAEAGGEGSVFLDDFDLNQGGGRQTWNWNHDGDTLGWTLGGTAQGFAVARGLASWQSTGNDPHLTSPADLAFDAASVNTLIFRCRNQSPVTNGAVYWSCTDAAGFAESRSLVFPIIPNDPGFTEYVIDLAADPEWRGTINRIRLDLPNSGNSAGATTELDYASLQYSGVMPKPDADSARYFITLTNAFLFGGLPDFRFQELIDQMGTRRFYTHVGSGNIVGQSSIPTVAAGLPRLRKFGMFYMPIFTVPVGGTQRTMLEQSDLREFQWRLNGTTWSSYENVEDWGGDRNYKRVTYSRLAPLQSAWQKQLAADWTQGFLAQLDGNEDRVPVFNLLVESELPSAGGSDDGQLGDYSPFAITEFRDWLRHRGVYDVTTGEFAGQGAPPAIVGNLIELAGTPRSQFHDDPTPADSNGTGESFNARFGTNFTTWTLRYWDLVAFPDPITDPNFDVSPEAGSGFTAGGFDAPRVRSPSNTFWRAWSWDTFDQGGAYVWPPGNPADPAFGFRQHMVRSFGRDLLAVLVSNGVPADHVFLHQIPGEFINAARQRSGATPIWTGYSSQNGNLGLTRFGTVPNLAAMLQYVGLSNTQSRGWGFFEWHPKPADSAGTQRDTPAYIEDSYNVTFKELKALVPNRMRVLTPGWWDFSGSGFNWNTFPTWNSGMVAAIKAFTEQYPDVPFWHQGPDVPDYIPPQLGKLVAQAGTNGTEQVVVINPRIWREYDHLWSEWGRFDHFAIEERVAGGEWGNQRLISAPGPVLFGGRAPGAAYEYRARAISASGKPGAWSEVLDWATADHDGDGLSDRQEGAVDPDGDGLANYEDLDSDGDTQSDATELARGRDPYSGVFESSFHLDGNFEGWSPKDVTAAAVTGGVLAGVTTSLDPWISRSLGPYPASRIAHVVVRMMKPPSATTRAEYFWANEDGGFASARRGEFATTNDGAFHTYFVNPASSPNAASWTGKTITGFRFDMNRANDGSSFVIDFILFSDGDFDRDGIDDLTEGGGDPDGDGLGSWEDPDADGDGIPDLTEQTADPDGDGTPNFLDQDSDNDGLTDGVEIGQGSDPYSPAGGVLLQWDTAAASDGAQGGAGIWQAAAPGWLNPNLVNVPWPSASSGNDDAAFQAPAGTVAIAPAGVTANQLDFLADGYFLTGGPLGLDGPGAGIGVAAGCTVTVSAPLARFGAAASDRFTVSGDGTLELSGGGSIDRKWHFRSAARLVGGAFVSAGATAAPDSNGMVVFGGATLTLGGATLTRTNGDADDAVYVGSPATTDEFAGVARSGHLVINSGSLAVTGGRGIAVAFGGAGNSSMTLNDGSVTCNQLHIGWNGNGSLTVNGGQLVVNTGTANGDSIRHTDGDSGTFTIRGGVVAAGNVKNSTNASGTTALAIRLEGGVLETERIWLNRGSNPTSAAHSITTRFNGGTLRLPATAPAGSTGVLIGDISGTTGILSNTAVVMSGGATIDTNGRIATITTSLAADPASPGGGLTKRGAGLLILTESGAYSGATTVEDGILRVPGPMFHDASTVTIGLAEGSGAVIDLTGTGTDTIAMLVIDGTALAPGLYDSNNSGGAITGVGKLWVAPSADYSAWAAAWAWPERGPGTAPADDFDGDGHANEYEYAFGLNPTSATSASPFASAIGVDGAFHYTRRDPARSGIEYTVLTSTDLLHWLPDNGAIQTPGATGPDGVQTVSVLLGTGPVGGRIFVKLKAH